MQGIDAVVYCMMTAARRWACQVMQGCAVYHVSGMVLAGMGVGTAMALIWQGQVWGEQGTFAPGAWCCCGTMEGGTDVLRPQTIDQ